MDGAEEAEIETEPGPITQRKPKPEARIAHRVCVREEEAGGEALDVGDCSRDLSSLGQTDESSQEWQYTDGLQLG